MTRRRGASRHGGWWRWCPLGRPGAAAGRGRSARARRTSVELVLDVLLQEIREEGVQELRQDTGMRVDGVSGARGWLTSPVVEEKRRRMVRTAASDFLSLAPRNREEGEGKRAAWPGGIYRAEEETEKRDLSSDFGKNWGRIWGRKSRPEEEDAVTSAMTSSIFPFLFF